jgi:hypothetical protein
MRAAPTKYDARSVVGFVVVAFLLGAGIPVALFHKSPDPAYYLGITMVYVGAAMVLANVLLFGVRLMRRRIGSRTLRAHACHASVRVSVRFWSDEDAAR